MTKSDVTHTVSAALAGLAIALQVVIVALAVLALVGLVVPVARRPLRAIGENIAGGEIWIAWVVALAATLGSLFFSEIADFIPCRLCWFQRIAMYPLAVLLLLLIAGPAAAVTFGEIEVVPATEPRGQPSHGYTEYRLIVRHKGKDRAHQVSLRFPGSEGREQGGIARQRLLVRRHHGRAAVERAPVHVDDVQQDPTFDRG